MNQAEQPQRGKEQFVSEAIMPKDCSFMTPAMSRGGPGLPMQFVWRKKVYEVADVLEQWKETGACRNGSPEQYVRKHWYRIKTVDGTVMKIYFERQPRKKQAKKRWWLATVKC